MRCSAHCTAASYDLEALSRRLRSTNQALRTFRGVVHVELGQGGEIYFFSYGVVVFWRVETSQEIWWLEILKEVERERLKNPENDVFAFVFGLQAQIVNDEISLPENKPLALLAASFGLGQSVKLSVFELSVEKALQHCQPIAQRLAKKGRSFLSRREIARRMGQLFLERSSINTHLDALDKPDIIWENDESEPYYDLVADYLDLSSRQIVLNRRLDIVKEIFDMLSSQLNHQHSATLEWIIIALILFDVVLTLLRDFSLHPFALSSN